MSVYSLHRGGCNTRNEFSSSLYYQVEIIYLVNNINNDYGEQKRVLPIYYYILYVSHRPTPNCARAIDLYYFL